MGGDREMGEGRGESSYGRDYSRDSRGGKGYRDYDDDRYY